jgi:uncharacterized alkaline shock family protein YloU
MHTTEPAMHGAEPSSAPGPGRTTIADAVVAKIAVLAAREIPGIHSMSTSGRVRAGAAQGRRGPETAYGPGVSVAVGQGQATVDLEVVTFYGQSIVEVADAVRTNVIERIEGMTGLEVAEVNITVDDLYVEGSGQAEQPSIEPPRA